MSETSANWVTICSSINLVHANMIKGYLEAQGIEVRLKDEHMGSMHLGWNTIVAGVQVQVLSDAVDEANKLLSQIEPYETMAGRRRFRRLDAILIVAIGAFALGILVSKLVGLL